MAAIHGFELSVSSGDTVIADGLIDGVAVESGTVDAAADSDGTPYVVYTGSAFDHVLAADIVATDTVLGTATVASNLVTAVSLAGRGADPVVSAAE